MTFTAGVICAVSYRAYFQFQAQVRLGQEAALRDDLTRLRLLIDQHAADRGYFPLSLDDLVEAGYMRGIPADPITQRGDWVVITGDDPNIVGVDVCVIDVRSASTEKSSEGTPYSEW
jgi:general secretion pathway protein G